MFIARAYSNSNNSQCKTRLTGSMIHRNCTKAIAIMITGKILRCIRVMGKAVISNTKFIVYIVILTMCYYMNRIDEQTKQFILNSS